MSEMTEEEISQVVARVLHELAPPVVSPLAVNMGHFTVAAGQTITADHMNSAIQRGIPKFSSATARDAQWTTPPVGAVCYLTDTNYLQIYDNAITGGANAWHVYGGLRMGYALVGGNASGVLQTIPAGADTLLTLRSAGGAANKPGRGTWNTDGSVTVPLTGTYMVSGTMVWPTNTTGDRAFYVKVYTGGVWTATGVSGGSVETNTPGGSHLRMGITAQVLANAGDRVGLFAYNGTSPGVPLTLFGGEESCRMGVHLLGAE